MIATPRAMRIEFNGKLTHRDNKKHIEHFFDVPAGATQLTITFEQSPRKARGQKYANQISLSLFDPNGFRGARHNNADQDARLCAAEATPGYLPGPLPPGRWNVVIDTHRVLPPDPVNYRIRVEIGMKPVDRIPARRGRSTPAPRGPGWYRGDLHGHTLHSDGSWDVPAFVQYARDFKLDFVALTDHNTVSGLAQLDTLAANDVLPIGGMELTTYSGHALALGTRQWHEWRVRDGVSMRDLAQAIMDSGALFVIAHPMSPGDPVCTGCDWQYADMMPGIAPAVEVWNGFWSEYNQRGLELYYRWLNEGHRLVATAGTDIHSQLQKDVSGVAANVVYAQEFSEAAVMDAIRQGHLYLSTGPVAELTATTPNGRRYMMGDIVSADFAADEESVICLRAEWKGTTSADKVRLIIDREICDQAPAEQAGIKNWTLEIGRMRWCLLEIRDGEDMLRAVTNPIFSRNAS